MKHSTLSLAALLLFALILAACGPATAPAPTVAPANDMVIIGYSAPGLVGAQLQIQQSLERHAREQGWQLLTTTSGGDARKQVEQIASYVTLGVDAIVAVPDDSKAICEGVAIAKAAGIPFYTIDRSTDGCAIAMTVLSDNRMAGRQSAEAMVQFLTERYGEPRGTVLEITGNMATDVAQARGGGFHDALAPYDAITIVTSVGDWDSAKAVAAVRETLKAAPGLDAIYVHSDAVYFDAVIATLRELGYLKARGKEGHIFLAGVDASAPGLMAIRAGHADQVSNQPIPDFGLVVEWVAKELRGEPVTEGEVTREGALWSPAQLKLTPSGAQLLLATTSVSAENVDMPGLWANQ